MSDASCRWNLNSHPRQMAHSYSRQEVHDVAAKLLASQKKVKNLKRVILAGAAAIVLGSALVLGLVFAANEASKEVKTSDRQLKDTNGNDIITATAKYAITVGDFNPVRTSSSWMIWSPRMPTVWSTRSALTAGQSIGT